MKAIIRLCVYRLIMIVMVVGGLHVTADYSRAQHEIFDENVIQKWKDYEAFSHSLQGTARSKRTRNGKTEESIYQFKQNRECALYIEPDNRQPTLLICSLANPHFMATIHLSKSDPGYADLRKYTPLPSDTEIRTPVEGIFFATSRHFAYGRSSWLRQVVLNPSFKVTKVAKEIQNGQELVRIDHIYNYVLHTAKDDNNVRQHGSIWLDPSRCWCIRRLKSSTEGTVRGERNSESEIEVVCESIDHPSGFPILKSKTEHYKISNYKPKQKIEGTSTTDYELEVNDGVPDSEFTLNAFGLLEPASEPVKKSIPLYVWILVAAGVCSVLAVGFRYLARRRRLAATS